MTCVGTEIWPVPYKQLSNSSRSNVLTYSACALTLWAGLQTLLLTSFLSEYGQLSFYSNFLRRFPYVLFWQETYPQTFSPEFLSIFEYNSWKKLHVTDFSKMDILQGFVWRKWWTINVGKTARETSNQTIIRWELMLNASQISQKKYTLSTFPCSNRRKINDSGKVLAFSVSEFYQSSITVQFYQPTFIRWLSITTVCVQMDMIIHKLLCISVRR